MSINGGYNFHVITLQFEMCNVSLQVFLGAFFFFRAGLSLEKMKITMDQHASDRV